MGTYIELVAIILWIICSAIGLSLGFYTLVRICRRIRDPNLSLLQKSNILTWAVSYLLIGLFALMFMLWYYIIENEMIKNYLDRMVVLTFHLSILLKIINTEYTINKHEIYRGYYFSFILVILSLYTLVIPPIDVRASIILQSIYLILFCSGISIYIATFLYIAYKTNDEERKMAIRLILFPLCIILAVVFLPYNVEVYYEPLLYHNILYLFPQILITFGLILMYSTYYRNLRGSPMDDILVRKKSKANFDTI